MRRLYFPLALVVLLVAAVLRIVQLHTLPPGPHYDEAANILITRSIAFDGADLFPIANSYQGRESLYFYLNAPLFRLVGDSALVMRISSVFVNLLTIAASMTLGRVMFRGRRGLVVGLAVGILMTLSFHQIFMSRQAYRAVTLPMMQAFALLFLWRGLNTAGDRRDWPWLALGGVSAGGALYTYMASRLFPLWLALGGLMLLVLDRSNLRRRLRQGVIFFGALALAALPMIDYALQNPDIFLQRLTEVSDGAVTVSLAESIRRHIEMFFIRGDFGNLRYNIPGRPYFTLPEGLLLLIGMGVAFWRLVHNDGPAQQTGSVDRATERAAYFLALLAPLMVIPSVISVAGYPPSHMRSLGMVPLVFVLVAIGFEALFRVISRYVKPEYVLVAVASGVLLVGGVLVMDDYFDWARRPDLFYQADGDLARAMQWLPSQVDDDTLVYVAAYHREHPTVITGWDGPVTWLGTDSLFLPPPGRDGLVIFAHDAPPPDDWRTLLSDAVESLPPGPDGGPAFWAYRVSGDTSLPGLQTPPETVRNNLVSLIGVRTSPAPAGERAELTMAWRIDQSPPYYRLRPILHLQNGDTVLASNDAFLLGTDRWRPGEVMLHRMAINIPPATPPGEYPLYVTWVDRDSETILSYIGEDGTHAGVSAQIGALEVTRPEQFPSPDVLSIDVREAVETAPGVRLLGWNPPATDVRPGQALKPVLFWQATPTGSPRETLNLTVSLRGERESVIWRGDLDYSPVNWVAGELIASHMHWPIPRDQEAGRYTLILEAPGQDIEIATVDVRGLPREFDPPPVETVLRARLGASLLLYGYDLAVNGNIQLDLVWSALQPVDEDYTVFVHVLDSEGQIVAQRDAMPVENRYPTSLWAAGEYIQDRYQFDNLPPGEYRLHIGLYTQFDGTRLPIRASGGTVTGDSIKLDDIIIQP